MAPITLGGVTLKHGLMLAPMAGITDTSFRLVCHEMGAEYAVTEMVSAKALCFEQRGRQRSRLCVRTAPLANIEKAEAPTAVQLFGSDPVFMAEAARLIEAREYRGAAGVPATAIDINMGCPVAKVVSNGEGSALMRTPQLAADIVAAIKRAVKLPVTVKIRAGFDKDSINAPELARRLEAAGADLITVHGRTRQQFYAPSSDNGVIAAVKKAVRIPVVGNGDIFTPEDALRMLRETGCDGIMPARGTLGNPFLFTAIRAALENTEYRAPTPRERLAVALAHTRAAIARKGEHVALPEMRKHLAYYCKGLRGAATARDAIMRAEATEEVEAIFCRLIAENEG